MKTIEKFVVAQMRGFLFLAALFLLTAMPIWAQTKEQPNSMPKRERMAITFISVKPEMVPDFENMIKTDIKPALAKGGAKWSDVWQTAGFGDTFEYVVVNPVENYAQYDGPSPMMKGMGKEGMAAWLAKASKMVNGVRTVAYESRPDMSYDTKMTEPPKLAVVTLLTVAAGRNAEFENFIKNDWLPVVKQSGVKGYWVSQVMFGGDVNQYLIVVPHENFAEMDKGNPVARVLGQDGMMKLQQKLPAGVIAHQERIVSRYLPELSYRPATANK